MINKKQLGFSAIELMITLFISVGFFTVGYQIYNLIITDGNEARTQARVKNIIDEYTEMYKSNTEVSCSASVPVNNSPLTISGLANVTVSVSITCPQINGVSATKETVSVSYGIPSKTITDSTIISNDDDTCPTGFIKVPGSKTYGTSNFCVMKYEARDAGGNVPVSTPTGSPWVNISQPDAITFSSQVADCDDCHLISEAEWLTIAQNVLSVAENWDTGTVGSGFIYSGHNDASPNYALSASSDDSDGYYSTSNSAPSNQKRTLTLSNGEVIWDMSGNVREWTSSMSTYDQPGIDGGGYGWRRYQDITNPGQLKVNVFPVSTGISGAENWDNTNGIGSIYSSSDETASRGLLRGGNWNTYTNAGILALIINNPETTVSERFGFRVAR